MKKFHDNESTQILHYFWTSTHRGKLPAPPPCGATDRMPVAIADTRYYEREKIKAMIEEAKQNYTASGNDDVVNFKFLVVGQGQRRKVIKVKRHKSQV